MTSPLFADTSDLTSSSSPGYETFARLVHRGSELLCDGDPCQAREYVERALALVPDNAVARNLLALSFFQIGQLERALVLYEALHAERPDSATAKVNVAVVLLKLGRASAARPLLEEVVRTSPERRRAWGYLGVALEQLGLIADAERALLAGHYASAAKRLRERHAPRAVDASSVPDVTAESARTAMPAYRRRTLPPDPWSSGVSVATGRLAYSSLPRFESTLSPPDLARATWSAPKERPSTRTKAASEAPLGEDEHEIPLEQTLSPIQELRPPSMSNAPKQNRPIVPLLDAALSSLLVVPHEATVVVHPTGLVLVGLVEGVEAPDGGLAARRDAVHALAGPLRREPLARRPPPTPQPFASGPSPFVRVSGTGQIVLAPPRGVRLLPLEMDADVAFLREDLVVAYDQALICDVGRMRRATGDSLALVRFRGDGVIVLGLEGPFLAFDVHGEESVTLRAESLIGWIGLLAPEPASETADDDDELLTFSGEGTVLFRAPHDT